MLLCTSAYVSRPHRQRLFACVYCPVSRVNQGIGRHGKNERLGKHAESRLAQHVNGTVKGQGCSCKGLGCVPNQDDDEDDDDDVEEDERERRAQHRYSLRDRSRTQVQPYVPGLGDRPRWASHHLMICSPWRPQTPIVPRLPSCSITVNSIQAWNQLRDMQSKYAKTCGYRNACQVSSKSGTLSPCAEVLRCLGALRITHACTKLLLMCCRGTVRRGGSDRGVSRKRRAGGYSGRWSDDDDVADDHTVAPWQVWERFHQLLCWASWKRKCVHAACLQTHLASWQESVV